MFSKEEIIYHLVNSLIAGALVFLGYFVGAGESISLKGVLASAGAASIVFINKFYTEYWAKKSDVLNNKIKTRRRHLFTFI